MVQNEAMPLNMCGENFLKTDTVVGIMFHRSIRQSEENVTNLDWILKA